MWPPGRGPTLLMRLVMWPLKGIQDVADETCLNCKRGHIFKRFSLRWAYFSPSQLHFNNLIFKTLKLFHYYIVLVGCFLGVSTRGREQTDHRFNATLFIKKSLLQSGCTREISSLNIYNKTNACLPVGVDSLLAGVGILCRLLDLWNNRWYNQYSVTSCLDEEFSPCISHDLLSMAHWCKEGGPTKYRHHNQLHWLCVCGGGEESLNHKWSHETCKWMRWKRSI